MQKFESTILFICPECKKESNVDVVVPEFSWASVDRASDLWSEDDIDFICPNCEEEFYGSATCYSSGCTITLDDYDKTYQGDFPMYGPDPDD